ncbi:MAG: hypothetical protein ACXWAT_12140 [Methylobacter sp.]
MNEYEVRYSETKKDGGRISCAIGTAIVYADNEDEVRQIFAEEEPDMSIDSISLLDASG